jgi:carotenoid cleavage dioxygenase
MSHAGLMERTLAWTSRRLVQRVPQSAGNRFLEGRYAPVREERSEHALPVTGSIPAELRGIYARIGPNPFEVSNPGAYHWFLGDGMVHGLRLEDGAARWYRNRWVGSDNANLRLGRPRTPGPCHSFLDVVNTNIIGHGGRLWALVEAGPLPAELDGDLNTVRRGLFDGAQRTAFSAHPHLDPATGELHAICYDALRPFRVQHIVVDRHCQVTRVESVPVRHGPMIHDCALTASNVVILDLPVTFSLSEMLRGYPFPYRWNPRHTARVGLLPRKGRAANIRWFEVDPCFVFHTCNAWDLEDGGAVMDVVVHARMFDGGHHGPEVSPITFERWTLEARSGRVQRQVIHAGSQEFPRCDERLNGQPYRYAYTAGFDHADTPQPLYRHDLHSGRTIAHHYGPHHVTGEAVFVPRRDASAEDDGWLMSYVYDLREKRSALVILNARDFDGPPQAVVHLPVPVPMGFHGNWIPDGV